MRLNIWQIGAIVFAVSALVVHVTMLLSLPSSIMSKTRSLLEARGVQVHAWSASPRMTPQTQNFVRPSPDLAYAVCLFDPADGPVQISAPAWDGYASLSVFDHKTNAVFVTSLDANIEEPRRVIIARKDDVLATDEATPIVRLEQGGIAIIRRLAPSEDLHNAAQALVAEATCAPVPD